jgi:hypothetical protein
MNASPGNPLRTLLLVVVLALGMSLSLVQGNLMAAEMAIGAGAGQAGPHGCDGCGDHEIDAGTCLSVCGSAAHGLVPGEPAAVPAASRTSFELGHLVLRGPSYSPEPGPPKILTLA